MPDQPNDLFANLSKILTAVTEVVGDLIPLVEAVADRDPLKAAGKVTDALGTLFGKVPNANEDVIKLKGVISKAQGASVIAKALRGARETTQTQKPDADQNTERKIDKFAKSNFEQYARGGVGDEYPSESISQYAKDRTREALLEIAAKNAAKPAPFSGDMITIEYRENGLYVNNDLVFEVKPHTVKYANIIMLDKLAMNNVSPIMSLRVEGDGTFQNIQAESVFIGGDLDAHNIVGSIRVEGNADINNIVGNVSKS